MASVTVFPTVVCFVNTDTPVLAPCTAADVVTSTFLITSTVGPSDPAASATATSLSESVPSDSSTAAPTSITAFATNTQQTRTTSSTNQATFTSFVTVPTNATAASASKSVSSKNSVSPGALAGATVGGFIAGLVLAAAIGLLFLRRGKRRLSSVVRHDKANDTTTSIDSDRTIAPPLAANAETPATATALAVDTRSSLPFLPKPVTDDSIRRALQLVMDQIESHVEWQYQDDAVNISGELLTELSRFETGMLSCPLQGCFEIATKPTVLIKHCLMFHIFNHTVAPGEGINPILPNEIAGVIGTLYNQSLKADATSDQVKAFALQKSLTAYLLPTLTLPRGRSTTPTPQAQKAKRFASEFTEVFKPWASPLSDAEQRSENLSQVIMEAVRTATWLFAQPDLIRFDWSLSGEISRRDSRAECVTVSPHVIKAVVNGRRLEREPRLLSAVVKRI